MDALDAHLRWIIAAPVYVLAYAAAAGVFWYAAQRRGMSPESSALLMTAGLIGGLAGANAMQFLATGAFGKSIEGGLAGGWLAVVWAKRQLGIVRPTGDLFALALPAGEAIGRVGCFIGGCCYGKAANVAWAVHERGELRHPAQLYLSLGAALCFATLLTLERRRVLPENGLFYIGGLLFCADRFVVEFFRDAPVAGFGLTLAQIGCVAGALFFVWKLSRLVQPPARTFEAHAT